MNMLYVIDAFYNTRGCHVFEFGLNKIVRFIPRVIALVTMIAIPYIAQHDVVPDYSAMRTRSLYTYEG